MISPNSTTKKKPNSVHMSRTQDVRGQTFEAESTDKPWNLENPKKIHNIESAASEKLSRTQNGFVRKNSKDGPENDKFSKTNKMQQYVCDMCKNHSSAT